jgi:TM2 domain-containing membrane protein YozV
MRARNPGVALVLSAIFPGLGQFYNRQFGKGVAFFVAGLVASWVTSALLPSMDALLRGELPKQIGLLTVTLFLLLICYVWSMVDAY